MKKKSLKATNKHLKKAKNLETYLSKSTASSTLVEGVTIKNVLLEIEDTEFNDQIKVNFKKNSSIWD